MAGWDKPERRRIQAETKHILGNKTEGCGAVTCRGALSNPSTSRGIGLEAGALGTRLGPQKETISMGNTSSILSNAETGTHFPKRSSKDMTHQERTAVSIVTGPDGAHAPAQLPNGDLSVGHDVSKVGAHLWGNTQCRETTTSSFSRGTPE